ncbi:hypothetical protein PUR_28690 [Paenibacillus sp. URB8-2]|nr:hypothetical protein PUR_28690 [Paenibacillus sp. URB8-2]
MDYKDQLLYTKILKFICVGGKVEGVRFGAVPQILITCSDNNQER